MNIQLAPDMAGMVERIVSRVPFSNVKIKQIICVRSFDSTSRARARIWSFPHIWQFALGIKPHYVIEVLSQHFDRLSEDDKTRVIIHELMHIPGNFSGALVPHRGRRRIDKRSVEKIFILYKNFKIR